jgi:hypothetical protein
MSIWPGEMQLMRTPVPAVMIRWVGGCGGCGWVGGVRGREKGRKGWRTFESGDAGADDAEGGVRGHGVTGAPAAWFCKGVISVSLKDAYIQLLFLMSRLTWLTEVLTTISARHAADDDDTAVLLIFRRRVRIVALTRHLRHGGRAVFQREER